MIYFDSDVLVNYFLVQDAQKHLQSVELCQSAIDEDEFFCSLLLLQETSYVLSRLKVEPDRIEKMMNSTLPYLTKPYGIHHFKRGIALAKKVGFQHINDCLHTAIAEEYCEELFTYNKADFKQIQKHTKLKITIL